MVSQAEKALMGCREGRWETRPERKVGVGSPWADHVQEFSLQLKPRERPRKDL